MIPELSTGARSVLRASHMDDLYVLENVRECNELVEKGILALSPDGHARLTTLGARWLLSLLAAEEMAVVCRCGLPLSEHNGQSPHDAPERHCRSFTPSEPVYTRPEALRAPATGAESWLMEHRYMPGKP